MIQQTSSIIRPVRGEGPVRKRKQSRITSLKSEHQYLFVPEREAQIKTHKKSQLQSFAFLLFRGGLCKHENI